MQKVLTAIDNERRRAVITEIHQRDTAVELSELAETIAAEECDKHPDLLSAQERKRVYVPLYQNHLATLQDRGLISYDKDSGMISSSKATAPVAELIGEIEDRCLTVE